MMMDLGYFAMIVGIIAGILVLTYLAIRAIDHAFRNKETDREYAYDAMMQNDAYVMERFNKRREIELGYQCNKQLVQSFCDRTKAMSMDIIKQVNESVFEQAKEMMKELQ